MNDRLWIEVRDVLELNTWNLPKSMYEWIQKRWTQTWIVFPQELIDDLQSVVWQYMRVMWLDTTLYPARVDIWFSPEGNPIIYEVTTWFVDQIGSCISIQQELWDDTWLSSLASTRFDSSVLTSMPYSPEYEVMREMFTRANNTLWDNWERTFVYWYPLDSMKWNDSFIPGWKGLSAEDKWTQSQILSRVLNQSVFSSSRSFSEQEVPYRELPGGEFTKLIFKQVTPKIKWDRNTIIFWKWKEAERRYRDWDMIAQEYIPAFRDSQDRRFEWKVLFMPSEVWLRFAGMYSLVDTASQDKNFWNMTIPNDGYPQWPWIIIS